MRWPSAWLVASSAVLALAGCGGSASPPPKPPPRIPAAVAQKLAADADAVAAQQGCAAHDPAVKLLDDVIAATSRIPPRYQEPLTSAANDLVARVPACPAPEPQEKGKGKHGHGKHKGHDDDGDD
jgi:hypothetical protein